MKGSNAVTILGIKNKYVVEQSRCIRCGKCIDACPMGLMPVLIYKASQTGSTEEMLNVHLMDCIECGCCAYTCPASVPLVLSFRASKQIVRDAAAKTKK
jgi:electron transport complex protein RnfC